ncbi:ABC transporter substrate-binding protein [Desulfoluna butyratoxydans]|uniref:Abc transporter substrate-binding protein n=1 Tax=Desulfoluna butyratoxydans TaxID=231438 RepID=A0A4U8YQ89_9BACT|nr:ABC transporter substrate-binding protein [Desulfoluna butyratoxydans]VFQ46001.1 abc transporter substrate-binding protein [Desulfoluna butyratoxydans]
MNKHLIYLTAVILALVVVSGGVIDLERRKGPHIGVLQWTEQVPPFRLAREGVQSGLASIGLKNGENLTLTVHNAEQSREMALSAIREFKRQKVDLLITLGTAGTLLAMEEAPDIPIVYTLVAAPDATGIIPDTTGFGPNLTGVSMRVPARIQLLSAKQIMPGISRLGILYCSETLAATATAHETAAAADSLGWQVVKVALDKSELDTLDARAAELAGTTDAIYIPADAILNLPTNMRRITSVTDKGGVPLIGVGGEQVRQGFTLMAVHCNFAETGKQVKSPVEKILAGLSAGSIHPQSPQLHELTINLKKARDLNIPIHRNAILMADNIYE